MKGVVHDASGSGQTLFVEPLVVVELGNAWREAQAAVDEEVGRILDELSALVGANATMLSETLEALAQFDFWTAKAQLAAEMDAIRPAPPPHEEVVLLSARHPGLTGRVVPIDIRLGDGYTALIITGPNTGGKTVALRTLGLLALMHQAGLHVPAEAGSVLPVFRDVLADIGDEQSIAQSLSTFSGHLRSIIRIVERAGPGTLVLLDELGAGTDPDGGLGARPGAARPLHPLGRARRRDDPLRRDQGLRARDAGRPQRVRGVRPRDAVADVPAHRSGCPGGSQAFAIAERLGLPDAIVDDARGRLTENQAAFEATLASIRTQEKEIAEAVDRARAAEQRATEALRTAEEERRKARRERDEAVRAARAEAERLVEGLKDDVAGVRRRLERETVTAPAIDAAVARAEQTLGRLPEPAAVGTRPGRGRAPHVAARRSCPEPERWLGGPDRGAREGRHAGDAGGGRDARLGRGRGPRGGGRRGSGIRRAGRRSEPASGDGGRGRGPGSGPAGAGIGNLQLTKARSVASSLDLRGARVEEALEALDRYLDDASLAGLEQVLIIHGLGTGALRDAVRVQAGASPLVKSLRPGERGEGGDGATIVRL